MSTTHDTAPSTRRQCENTLEPLTGVNAGADPTDRFAGVSFDLAMRINPLIDTDLGETATNVAEALDFLAVVNHPAYLNDNAGSGLYRLLDTLSQTLRIAKALTRGGSVQ